MYAFISNEYRAVVTTERQLEFLISIYSYPKFKRVKSYEEARSYFSENERKVFSAGFNKFGKGYDIGYISIEYFIGGDNNIYYNIYTKHFGFIKLVNVPSNVKQDASYDLLKIKICGVVLNNGLIAHHCIAITNILKLLDDFINVELILPDISIYLACTKYRGSNFSIKQTLECIDKRFGDTYFTVRGE